MTFDGYPWGAADLMLPRHGHPSTAATAEVLRGGLEGAYGFRRTAARQVGQVLYTGSLTRINETNSPVYATSPVGVGVVEGYVPAIATDLIAEVVFISPSTGEAQAQCYLQIGATQGPTHTLLVDLDDPNHLGTAYRGVGDPYANPIVYATQRITASIPLASITLDTDLEVEAHLALRPAEENPSLALAAYISSVSVVWVANQ